MREEDPPANVSSFGARQFHAQKSGKPAKLSPRTALEAALEFFDQTDEKPDHIIIMVGKNVGDEGASGTSFYQAGDYRHHAQMGLCLEAMNMIRESGQD